MLGGVLLVVVAVTAVVLLLPAVRNSPTWHATVTPLASIIGSGFLVIVPVLGDAVGGYAALAMAAVVLVAYVIGAAVRYNIRYAEPLLEADAAAPPRWVWRFDRAADTALGFAYVISVTFYLRLLAAFLLRAVGIEQDPVAANAITTAVLFGIGLAGWIRGLRFLEWLELYAVSAKLSVIAALLVGWSVYDARAWGEGAIDLSLPASLDPWHTARVLAGTLLVVQGFETSRYLGHAYSAALRVRTMRLAQWIAGGIYVVFVALATPTLHDLPPRLDETAIIDLAAMVAAVLPPLLIFAATMSQFSAAVADTVGAGGLFAQTIGRRLGLREHDGYALVAVLGIALVWSVNIFALIAHASRAFAVYYALQALVACATAASRGERVRALGYALLAVALFVGAAIALPVG
ncbi:MAG: hypothetical protein D6776_09285 [Planctomycetota bacterium]|nr:MAG: hypothetical protein D6776_09285 [Planctomycetota bacterium]